MSRQWKNIARGSSREVYTEGWGHKYNMENHRRALNQLRRGIVRMNRSDQKGMEGSQDARGGTPTSKGEPNTIRQAPDNATSVIRNPADHEQNGTKCRMRCGANGQRVDYDRGIEDT